LAGGDELNELGKLAQEAVVDLLPRGKRLPATVGDLHHRSPWGLEQPRLQ
jgi:hypothetical protein